MKKLMVGLSLLALLSIAGPAHAQEPDARDLDGMVSVGVGMPELLMLKAGWFAASRLTVEVQLKSVILNNMVGVGVTGYLLGDTEADRPPKHALLLSGSAMLNPTLQPIRLESGGDTLGAAVGAYVGYGYQADSGFLLRPLVGALFFEDGGFAAGPSATVEAGWAF